MVQILSLIFIALLQNVNGLSTGEPVVVTKLGSIRGIRAEDGPYTKFLGVPYGRVNESNVFGDSLPYSPFENIFEANDDKVICPQLEDFNFTLVGTIDCLNLNIYVPDTATPQNRLPVLVYIFGGRFEIGRPDRFMFGPQYLIRHDVIFVAVNYRLGPYGFMCLDIPEVPGNQGLKDQRRAIRWINDNIEAFNGDPSRITLFGNSAGAMSIAGLLLAENERLWNNVILHSGSAVFSTFLDDSDPNMPQKIAAEIDYSTDNIYEALSYLNMIDEHKVIDAAIKAGLSFRPCVEQKFSGVEAFLLDYPINMKEDKVDGMAIMIGYTREEGLNNFANPNLNPNNTYSPLVFSNRLRSNFDFDEDLLAEIEPIVRRFYIGDEEISEKMKWELIDFASDSIFIYSTLRAVPRFLEGGAEKIYQFVFSYDGTRNYVKIKSRISAPGAAHGDELGYLFNMGYAEMPQPTSEDQLIIDRITTMWTNFVKYGDPTPVTTELLPVKWQPITKGSPQHYLEINTNMKAGMGHIHQRVSFWDLLYKEHSKYETGYRDPKQVPDSSSIVVLSYILPTVVILNVFFC